MDHIEADLKYCVRCEDEYLATIENCGVCGDPLIIGEELMAQQAAHRERMAGRIMELGPEDNLVNVRTGSVGDMKYLASLLQSERIPSLIAGDDNACGKGCCPSSFFLQVRHEDAQDAMAVLDREFKAATALDSHDVGSGDAIFNVSAGVAVCPACGTSFVTTSTSCPDCGLCLG